jgi:hypothetical protein
MRKHPDLHRRSGRSIPGLLQLGDELLSEWL